MYPPKPYPPLLTAAQGPAPISEGLICTLQVDKTVTNELQVNGDALSIEPMPDSPFPMPISPTKSLSSLLPMLQPPIELVSLPRKQLSSRPTSQDLPSSPHSTAYSSPIRPTILQRAESPTAFAGEDSRGVKRGIDDSGESSRSLGSFQTPERKRMKVKYADQNNPPPALKTPDQPLKSTPSKKPTTVASPASFKNKPFRSPLLAKNSQPATPLNLKLPSTRTYTPSPLQSSSSMPPPPFPVTPLQGKSFSSTSTPVSNPQKASTRPSPALHRSASKPFKSHTVRLSSSPHPNNYKEFGKSSHSATVLQLERKLQTFRRASKITNDKSIENLQALTKKWKNAAREAAEDVWSLVKDGDGPSSGGDSSSNDYFGPPSPGSGAGILAQFREGFEKSWGWAAADKEKEKEHEHERENSAYDDDHIPPSADKIVRDACKSGASGRKSKARYDDVASYDFDDGGDDGDCKVGSGEEEEGPVVPEWNLGMMLNGLGVAKETLGWNDEDECFID